MTINLPLPSDLTHHEALICMWLGSDPPLLESMRKIAVGDESEHNDGELAEAVYAMLYDPFYGVTCADLHHVEFHGGNKGRAAATRVSVPERAMDAIDEDGWARIRTALLAGWEG